MGTIMRLERFDVFTAPYYETKYDIDQAFLDLYGAVDPVIPTGKDYYIGADQESLHVFLNGQRLFRDVGYEEIDERHIKLHTHGMELLPGEDYIYIEVHENYYCSSGSSVISGERFQRLESEISGARGGFNSLDDRVRSVQQQLVMALTGQTVVKKEYIYNSTGQVSNEVITGDVNIRRTFTYYNMEEDGRLKGEIFTETVAELHNNLYVNIYRVTRYYDPITRRLLREEVTPL